MSLPAVLLYGRTALGANVPVLVDADGLLAGGGNPFDQDLDTTDAPTFAGITLSDSATLANGKAVRGDTTTAHTFGIDVYDVDGTAYKRFVTGTNGNTPELRIAQPAGGSLIIILPTADPHVVGALWNDTNVVTVSAG